jgi:hypothetical protein
LRNELRSRGDDDPGTCAARLEWRDPATQSFYRVKGARQGRFATIILAAQMTSQGAVIGFFRYFAFVQQLIDRPNGCRRRGYGAEQRFRGKSLGGKKGQFGRKSGRSKVGPCVPRQRDSIVQPMRALAGRGLSAPSELICASRHAAK